MRSTRSNICAALYGTSTDFFTHCMGPRVECPAECAIHGTPVTGAPTRNPMSIVENRKAFHEYFIEERFEAGLSLEGWEVKAIRAGRANLKEAYVVIKNGEIVLIGA